MVTLPEWTRVRRLTRGVEAPVAGSQTMSKRVRKRRSARTSAGPNARQKSMLPVACATSNGSDVAK